MKDKTLPYRSLLTLLFEHFGIDLHEDVRGTYTSNKDMKISMVFWIAYNRDVEEEQQKQQREEEEKVQYMKQEKDTSQQPYEPSMHDMF